MLSDDEIAEARLPRAARGLSGQEREQRAIDRRKAAAAKIPACADCGHKIEFHDPCSECAREGRAPCRSYATTRTRRPTRRGSAAEQRKKRRGR